MRAATLLIALMAVLTACGTSGNTPTSDVGQAPVVTPTLGPLPALVPPLPFADNPDPTQCGIPTQWGDDDPAWISGIYEGELLQPVVYLYDSHLRREVVGQIPHGGRVTIELSQSNPVLDYYRVRSLDLDPPQDGWVPAPFVSFEPPGL